MESSPRDTSRGNSGDHVTPEPGKPPELTFCAARQLTSDPIKGTMKNRLGQNQTRIQSS